MYTVTVSSKPQHAIFSYILARSCLSFVLDSVTETERQEHPMLSGVITGASEFVLLAQKQKQVVLVAG